MFIILGKKLIETKKVRYALTNIFGIGFSNANKMCNFLNIPKTVKVSELTEFQKSSIISYIKQNFMVETRLKQTVRENILTKITLNSIQGFRHRLKLPVRGQRTHSNAKTCKKNNFTS